MSQIKEFTTAVADLEDKPQDEPDLEFTVDGQLCYAYKPLDGQFAVLMASTGRHSSGEEQIAGIINFFVAVLDDASQTLVINKLLDRKDSFGIKEVEEIMRWMIEEWSGRPTQSSSGSTPSRKPAGRKSTQPTPALT